MSEGTSNPSEEPPEAPHRRRRSLPPGATDRLLIVASIVTVALLVGYGLYGYIVGRPAGGTPTLRVYAYSSLFSGNCGQSNLTDLFHRFERTHAAHIELVCPPGNLASTLIAQKSSPQADLVIGLDEVTAPQADAAGVLLPYSSHELPSIATTIRSDLTPDRTVTPYEYGLLGIDYTPQFRDATHGAVANLSFPSIASNSTWASTLVIEDPTRDITGEEFLLWEIQFYAQVLHQDWTPFWVAADPHLQVDTSWSGAYARFTSPSGPSPPQMVVSYTLDTTSVAPGTFYCTVAHDRGVAYAWRTTYGIGIVRGTTHLALDQAFVDWFLQGEVQSELPANEFEYPANVSTHLPASFQRAIDPATVVALNTPVSPATVNQWLDQWQTIATSHPRGSG